MKHLSLSLFFLLTAQLCVAQSSIMQFGEWLKEKRLGSYTLSEVYRATDGLTTSLNFRINSSEQNYERGDCDIVRTLSAPTREQMEEFKGRLYSAMENAEQSWSTHRTENDLLSRKYLATNGVKNDLRMCTPGGSHDLSEHDVAAEILDVNVLEGEQSVLIHVSVYCIDHSMAQQATIALDLTNADKLLKKSNPSNVSHTSFTKENSLEQSITAFSDNATGTTQADIYSYASTDSMPISDLESEFRSCLSKHQECKVIHNADGFSITSPYDFLYVSVSCRKIIRAHSTTPDIYVPHNWWTY